MILCERYLDHKKHWCLLKQKLIEATVLYQVSLHWEATKRPALFNSLIILRIKWVSVVQLSESRNRQFTHLFFVLLKTLHSHLVGATTIFWDHIKFFRVKLRFTFWIFSSMSVYDMFDARHSGKCLNISRIIDKRFKFYKIQIRQKNDTSSYSSQKPTRFLHLFFDL